MSICPSLSACEFVLDGDYTVPGTVFTLDGFREWRLSEDFPDLWRATFAGGRVYLETHLLFSNVYECWAEGFESCPRPADGHASDLDDAAELIIDGWLRVPATVFEIDGFRDWVLADDFPEKLKASFLGGRIEIQMSPEELHTHTRLKGDVFADLLAWVRQHRLGELFTDGALLTDGETGLSTEPDMMFCRWESIRSGRVQYVEKVRGSGRFVEVGGAPDLVVEVISRSSVRKDHVELAKRYFKAGVQEYWTIDGRGKTIDFRVFARGPRKFKRVAAEPDGYLRSDVLGGSFLVTRERNELDHWEYRLLGR